MADSLRELLERAVALEEKADELKEAGAGVIEAPVVPVVEEPAGDDAAILEELTAKIGELEDTIYALTNSSEDPVEPVTPAGDQAAAEDPSFQVDEEQGTDFDAFDDLDGDEPGAEATGMVTPPGADVITDPVEPAEPIVEGEKADGWMPCPKCGSTKADEYADGTARCADCGTPLKKREKKDDEPAEEPAAEALEEKSAMTTLSEIELLQQRRAALDA